MGQNRRRQACEVLQDSALLEQAYIRDPETTVADRIKQAEKDAGAVLAVESFVRYELGAGEYAEEAA